MSAEEDLFSQRRAEVLRLTYAENLGIRAIAGRLGIARKTVRRLLDGDRAIKKVAAAPRTRLLDRYDGSIRQILDETPEMHAPALLERFLARALAFKACQAQKRVVFTSAPRMLTDLPRRG